MIVTKSIDMKLEGQPTFSVILFDFEKKGILGTALDGAIIPPPVTATPVG